MSLKLNNLCVILLLASCAISKSALGFWIVSNDVSGALTRDGVHQAITGDALDNYEWILHGRVTPLRFHPDALKELKIANESVDKNDLTQDFPSRHCDNDQISQCSRHVQQREKRIVKEAIAMVSSINNGSATNSKAKNIRFFIGTALHTLQDFYSHSNWVHFNNDILEIFGKSEFHNNYNFPKDTCEENDPTTLLPNSQLTSGHYVKNPYMGFEETCQDQDGGTGCILGQETIPFSWNAPYKDKKGFQKCVHGHVCNGTSGGTKFACTAFKGRLIGHGTEGLHKDSIYREDGVRSHDKARRQAVRATTDYVDRVLRKIRDTITDDEIEDKIIQAILGNMPPEVLIITPSEGETLTQPTSIEVKATARSGVSRVVFKVDGAVIGEDSEPELSLENESPDRYSYEINPAIHGQGVATIIVEVFDTYGNRSMDSINVIFVRDVEQPPMVIPIGDIGACPSRTEQINICDNYAVSLPTYVSIPNSAYLTDLRDLITFEDIGTVCYVNSIEYFRCSPDTPGLCEGVSNTGSSSADCRTPCINEWLDAESGRIYVCAIQ